jgi:hypothetical protein
MNDIRPLIMSEVFAEAESMTQHFENIKQSHPNIAKALGITADMDYEEWREAYDRMVIEKLSRPLPVDISELQSPAIPFPRSWYSFYPRGGDP